VGKLHGGNDLCKAILYPRLIFKCERFGMVIGEVGHKAITKLLQITHRQLIYRCVLGHDRTAGTLVNQHKAELLGEITKQLSMGMESLMEDDKYLLECSLMHIVTTNGKQQEYWLLEIQAAREASQLWKQAKQQQCIWIS
jgi:hypothetical protein